MLKLINHLAVKLHRLLYEGADPIADASSLLILFRILAVGDTPFAFLLLDLEGREEDLIGGNGKDELDDDAGEGRGVAAISSGRFRIGRGFCSHDYSVLARKGQRLVERGCNILPLLWINGGLVAGLRLRGGLSGGIGVIVGGETCCDVSRLLRNKFRDRLK